MIIVILSMIIYIIDVFPGEGLSPRPSFGRLKKISAGAPFLRLKMGKTGSLKGGTVGQKPRAKTAGAMLIPNDM